MGRMLIDACKPFSWRDRFPRSNVFTAAERRQVEAKWRDLLGTLERGEPLVPLLLGAPAAGQPYAPSSTA